ncbi:MAG: DNA polymerase III subunit gamma/tau [Gemmatimonadaceae bacterium]
MHLALARKYRPKTFADVAVQSHVSNTLKGAIARGRVAHGYLLCGPRGVGKTTLARVLAMALNCDNPGTNGEGEPCGECASCTRIWTGATSLDVVEIDAASNRGVDDARELRERAMYAPSAEGRWKVYIVDEAHMLTREAWNALLKVLEEPPPRVVFVFATTEPQKIAQAAAPVLSRLQRFDFKRIGPADIRQRLSTVLATEKIASDPDALAMLARAADGSMRDALSLTDQVLASGEEGRVTVARVRDALGLVADEEYLAILDLIADRNAGAIFGAVARLGDAGVDFGALLAGLTDMFRAQLAIVLGGTMPEVGERTREALTARADRWSAGDLLRMLSAVTELEPRFRRSGQQQVLLESLLVRFALLDHTVDLERVLRGMGGAAPWEAAVARTPSGSGAAARERVSVAASAAAPVAASAPPTVRERESAPRAAPAAVPGAASSPLSLNALAESWDAIVAAVRTDGRQMLAVALGHSAPAAVTARGEITLELDAPSDMYEQAISSSSAAVLAAIAARFAGAKKLTVRSGVAAPATDPSAPRRLSEEQIKAERLAAMRKKDPALDAAVDTLDLELLD